MRKFFGSIFGSSQEGQGASVVQNQRAEQSISAAQEHLRKAREFFESEDTGHVPPDILHPDRQGIELVDTDMLINANRQLITQILDSFTDKKFIKDFDLQMIDFIRRVAHWMGPIPASRTHHHTNRGGLFTHSLSVGLGALNMSASRNVTYSSAPRNKDADNLAWQLIAFICGLLHDIGKVNTIGTIHAYAVDPDPEQEGKFRSASAPSYSTAWEPMVMGFGSWAKMNRVRSYFISYDRQDDFVSEEYTQRYILALVPRQFLAFIYYSNVTIRQQFEDFIRNPGSAAKTPIFGVVQDADHINVAQSIDPRRKPGSVEASALIMRRFAEFASEVPWNLPTSPFIFAHAQHQQGDSIRFYGVPFFVVTESSIEQFERYILSRPMLGVHIDQRRMTELIFNALETTSVMHRTVETILPDQIVPDGMADCIPASRATVRFAARHANSLVIQSAKPQDAQITLNVIPLKLRVPANAVFDGPTLAFEGTPQSNSAAVLYATIEKQGALEPSDHGLRHDPEYMAAFKGGKPRKPVDYSDLGLDRELEETLHATTLAPPIKGSPEDAPNKTAKRGIIAEMKKLSDSGQLDLRPALIDHASPVWVRLFASLADLPESPDDSPGHRAWAAIWLYLRDNPHSSATAVAMPSGQFAIKCLSLDIGLRDALFKALNDAGLKGKMLSPYWQREKITTDHARFERLFELTKDTDGKPLFRLPAPVCACLEEALAGEGEGAGA